MRKAAIRLVAGCSLAILSSTFGYGAALDASGAIAHARRLIDANDHAAATAVLEDALIEAEAKDRPAIVELLRQSYGALAKQAGDAGRQREAAHYRDNLAILNREQEPPAHPQAGDEKPKPSAPVKPAPVPEPPPNEPAPAAAPPPAVVKPPAKPTSAPHSGPPAGEKMASRDQAPPLHSPSPSASTDDPVVAAPLTSIPESAPSQSAPAMNPAPAARGEPVPDPAVAAPLRQPKRIPAKASVEEADRFFAAGNYYEAGKCYAELARESRLPAKRKEHWGYCRYVALVDWIKKGPRSEREWNQILEELQSIQRLTPKSWYGEYLRDKVAEVRRNGPRLPQSDDLVVRASAPDDAEPRRFSRIFGKFKSRQEAQGGAAPQPARPVDQPVDLAVGASGVPAASLPVSGQNASPPPAPRSASPADGAAPVQPLEPLDIDADHDRHESSFRPGSDWQIHETANFRIFHHDARLAELAGQAAEAVRAAQGKQWGSPPAAGRWTPACEIYLYADGKALAAATQQPETSPGFSTMTSDGSRVVARRVNLRADHPQLLQAILPHEVTHVVLADIFTTSQIPRWADEGLAVMAEPHSEQQLRWAELRQPLENGRVFKLNDLMAMDYPDPKDWSLYYAQSVSLTRFLVEQDSPERFIRFVLDSHEKGVVAALEESYQIKGFNDLQSRWTEFARKQIATATATASARDGSDGPATTTR